MAAQMTVYHVHESTERIYYRVQAIDPFFKAEMPQYSAFFDMNFIVPGTYDPA